MDTMLKVLLPISILVNLFFLYRAVNGKKGIRNITAVLAKTRKNGFGRRIHVGMRYRNLEELAAEMNMLLDKFQAIIEEKHELEMSHRQLVSDISHDIRTPLTSLLGFVEVLREDRDINLRQQKEYLDIIYTKGLSLYRLIQEFFELSKLESEDMEIEPEKLNLTDILSDVIASFYQDFVINGITPDIQIPEEKLYIIGNRAAVERIIQNLLSNALKYGGSGGAIGVSVREDGDRIWTDIWDNGLGILEKDIPFLFNRLYTTELSRNERMRGSGLGLAISKQLAEKLDGGITVSSTPGEMTTFSLYLRRFR